MTLRLTGSSHGEIEPRKATYPGGGAQHKNPDLIGAKLLKGETFPPHMLRLSGKSQGNPMVELATPKRTQQSDQGNEEKQIKGLGKGRTLCRLDEQRNSLIWLGCSVIAARRSEHTNTKRAWLDTALQLVNFGRRQTGGNFGAVYSAYKCECGKLSEQETSGKLSPSKS